MIPIGDINPTLRRPYVVYILILLNVLVYIFTAGHLRFYAFKYGLIPSRVTLLSLFSYQFLHGGLFHLIGNMLYLWIFGNNVEDVLGHFKFIIFYFICGLSAAIVHIIFHPLSTLPLIGASGAISGVLGAYLVLFPFAPVVVLTPFIFYPIIGVPAFVFLIVWILMQIVNLPLGGPVAWDAHIAGFFTGVVLIKLMTPHRRYRRYF